jgi:hypothetical protein
VKTLQVQYAGTSGYFSRTQKDYGFNDSDDSNQLFNTLKLSKSLEMFKLAPGMFGLQLRLRAARATYAGPNLPKSK